MSWSLSSLFSVYIWYVNNVAINALDKSCLELSLSRLLSKYLITFPRKYFTPFLSVHHYAVAQHWFTVCFCFNFLEMPNPRETNSFSECRLCGIGGHHEIDIWNGNLHNDEFPLSEKIFECVGLQVC